MVAWIRDFYKQSIVYISYQCNIIKSIRKIGSENFLCNDVFTSQIISSHRVVLVITNQMDSIQIHYPSGFKSCTMKPRYVVRVYEYTKYNVAKKR